MRSTAESAPEAYATPREWLEGKRRFVRILRRLCGSGREDRRSSRVVPAKPDREVLMAALNWHEEQHMLRVLQTGSFEPVGSEKTIQVDVRIVSATNKNLENEIAAGRFREDLFYRLAVVPVEMPPLRDRIIDVPLLAEYFLKAISKESGKGNITISTEALGSILLALRPAAWRRTRE